MQTTRQQVFNLWPNDRQGGRPEYVRGAQNRAVLGDQFADLLDLRLESTAYVSQPDAFTAQATFLQLPSSRRCRTRCAPAYSRCGIQQNPSPGGNVQPKPARRVLVVEDEAEIRDFVAMVLGSEGYRVTTAANGAVALDRVGREAFDLILLDMRMPVMDGWTFASTYRAGMGPHAPIVVLTAARDAAERAAQIHAEGYLGKPFDLNDLLSMVAQYTRGAP